MSADFRGFKCRELTDVLVDNRVVVEIKAPRHLVEENEAQLLNSLKATYIEVGHPFIFGVKPEVKRKAFDNLRNNLWGDLRPKGYLCFLKKY